MQRAVGRSGALTSRCPLYSTVDSTTLAQNGQMEGVMRSSIPASACRARRSPASTRSIAILSRGECGRDRLVDGVGPQRAAHGNIDFVDQARDFQPAVLHELVLARTDQPAPDLGVLGH
jgi:hypothetical protein